MKMGVMRFYKVKGKYVDLLKGRGKLPKMLKGNSYVEEGISLKARRWFGTIFFFFFNIWPFII